MGYSMGDKDNMCVVNMCVQWRPIWTLSHKSKIQVKLRKCTISRLTGKGTVAGERLICPLTCLNRLSQLQGSVVVVVSSFWSDLHPAPKQALAQASGQQIVVSALLVSYQELVHAGLTLFQVDAFDGHLLLPRLAECCLDHSSGSAPSRGEHGRTV